ncbi:hypothetical protein GAY28_24870 [Azospirillum brasilense]|nr:hypothetical protein [Azospirillum brasilense]
MAIVSNGAMQLTAAAGAAMPTAMELRRALKVIEREADALGLDLRGCDRGHLVQSCGRFERAALAAAGHDIDEPKARSLAWRALALTRHPVMGGHSDTIPHSVYEAAATASMPITEFRPGVLEETVRGAVVTDAITARTSA